MSLAPSFVDTRETIANGRQRVAGNAAKMSELAIGYIPFRVPLRLLQLLSDDPDCIHTTPKKGRVSDIEVGHENALRFRFARERGRAERSRSNGGRAVLQIMLQSSRCARSRLCCASGMNTRVSPSGDLE